jgi:hypothetical protein
MDLISLIEKAGFTSKEIVRDSYYERDGGTNLTCNFDLKPSDFLHYAEVDFASNNLHGFINALSNAKRAIDCEVETVLGCFGLLSKRRMFPEKQNVLQEIGLLAPSILRKIVNKRNDLEHQFKCPTKEEVEDAIGIAGLFIDACDRTLNTFWSFYIASKRDNSGYLRNCLYFDFKDNKKCFEIRAFDDKDRIGTINIPSSHKIYLAIVRMAIAIDKEKDAAKAIQNFFDIALSSA